MTAEVGYEIIGEPPDEVVLTVDDVELIVSALDRLTAAVRALPEDLLRQWARPAVAPTVAPQPTAPLPQPQAPTPVPPPALGPQQGVSWGGSAPPQDLGNWVCPVHGTVKVVPAGVSQRTQRAYDAFLACPERGCNEKPPRKPRN